jgi:hypothetical protein
LKDLTGGISSVRLVSITTPWAAARSATTMMSLVQDMVISPI